MVLLFLLDLDHVDSTEEALVNPVERCLGSPYNMYSAAAAERSLQSSSSEKNQVDSVYESFSPVSDFLYICIQHQFCANLSDS